MRVTRARQKKKRQKKIRNSFLKMGVLLTIAGCLYLGFSLSNWGDSFSWAKDASKSDSTSSSLAASSQDITYKEAQGKVIGLADNHTIEVDLDGKTKTFHCQGNTKCESVVKNLSDEDGIVLYYHQDENGQNKIIDIAIIYTHKQGELVQYIEGTYSGMADSHTIEVTLPKQVAAAYQLRGPLLEENIEKKFTNGDRVILTGIKTEDGIVVWNMEHPQH